MSKNLVPTDIFNTIDTNTFTKRCFETFHFQINQNEVYSSFCELLDVKPWDIEKIEQIPFLPVEIYKSHKVLCGKSYSKMFESSGTTSENRSIHFVKDISLYDDSLVKGFRLFYGEPSGWCFLALLPSYIGRENSSLIYMMRKLMDYSNHPLNGFFLQNGKQLTNAISQLKESGQKTILIGVSFALLDFSSDHCINLTENFVVMETGGMKGRREEMVRNELHKNLCSQLEVAVIHSEYGMTELLSQAYSQGGGLFRTPPWMKVLIRDLNDPFCYLPVGRTGAINIIDLANRYSCSFISTQDLGRVNNDGTFEVLGRYDYADVRGCNLMVS
ncbi:MAG TPA: hypothetical protein VLH16_07845 [Bacteroidales bacterium]|nr:hypothetical protein [Bacteroidales bacterium]